MLTDPSRENGFTHFIGIIALSLMLIFFVILSFSIAADSVNKNSITEMTVSQDSSNSVSDYETSSHSISNISVENNTVQVTTEKEPVLEQGAAQYSVEGKVSDIELSSVDGRYVENRKLRDNPQKLEYTLETNSGEYILTLIDDPETRNSVFNSYKTDEITETIRFTIEDGNITRLTGKYYDS